MPARNSKGRFIKGGRRRARRSPSHAVVKYRTKHVTKYRTRRVGGGGGGRRRSRRSAKGGRLSLLHIIGGGLALGYLSGSQGPAAVKNIAAKIPGQKTFGTAAVLGGTALAIDKWVKPNKWLRIAGYIGVGYAAVKAGEQGTAFKWVGDVGDDYDMSGDDDMADVEGDDDMADVEDLDE
jgi:hypothetical protein